MAPGLKPLLKIGSFGPAVRELQSLLNQLPTSLARLTEDGQFGSKTRGRVVEYQGSHNLVPDGVVGPFTWESLLSFVNQHGPGLVEAVIGPEDESKARETIATVARQQYETFGGFDPAVHMGSVKIAGSLCANPATRARQGGAQLAAIFSVAGVTSASKCPFITVEAEKMYQRNHSAEERNKIDIPSWCGIFALYCCKMAGLRLSPWPLRYSLMGTKPGDEFRLLTVGEKPMKGDIGIKLVVNGKKLNHHFVIVDAPETGSSFSTVDGNAGMRQEIVARSYTQSEIYKSNGGFLRVLWDRVLPRATSPGI